MTKYLPGSLQAPATGNQIEHANCFRERRRTVRALRISLFQLIGALGAFHSCHDFGPTAMGEWISQDSRLILHEVVVNLGWIDPIADLFQGRDRVAEAVRFSTAEITEQRPFVLREFLAERGEYQQRDRVHGVARGEDVRCFLFVESGGKSVCGTDGVRNFPRPLANRKPLGLSQRVRERRCDYA